MRHKSNVLVECVSIYYGKKVKVRRVVSVCKYKNIEIII